MGRLPWFPQTTKWTRAGLVLAPLVLFVPQGIPAARSQPAAHADIGTYYFVCTFQTSTAGVLTDYVSAVNGLPPGAQPGPFLGQLAPAFAKFIAAKYNTSPTTGSNNCVYQNSQASADALKQRDLTTSVPKGYTVVDTGWIYADATPAATAAAAPVPPIQTAAASVAAPPAGPAAAPASLVQGPPVSTSIVMRLVDTIRSDTDQPGRQYRAVVTQATSAGSVSIPANTEGTITLAQSGGNWSTQLSSLSLNGQAVPVTSSSVSATSGLDQVQQNVQKLGGLLGGLGALGGAGNRLIAPTTAVANAIATGPRVVLATGTALTFTASVPQPVAQVSAGSAGPSAAPAATAAAPVVASATAPGNTAAPQTGGGPVGYCEMQVGSPTPGVQPRLYVSAVFDVPNGNDRDKWELAFNYYVQMQEKNIAYSNGPGCTFYPVRAGAERGAQNRKNNLGNAKLIETGWAYTGPAQLPPPAVPQPSTHPQYQK